MLPQHILRVISRTGKQALAGDRVRAVLPWRGQPEAGGPAHVGTVVQTSVIDGKQTGEARSSPLAGLAQAAGDMSQARWKGTGSPHFRAVDR